MPIIDPGRPDTSYLMYKLLVNDRNYGDGAERCTTRHQVPLPDGACLPPSPAETERLRDWFVRGQAMPLRDPPDSPGWSVTQDDLRAIQRYIAAGASTDHCE